MALQKFPRICPTCEASCGLVIEADQESGEVGRVSGDPDHPSSQGYVCPKSQAIKALREDPDRLRKPLIREGGSFREASWDEALDYAAAGLKQVLAEHGPQALGVYLGNPTAHVAALQMVSGPLLGAMPALLTGAAAIDNFARNMVGAFLYGNIGNVPVPDVDRTEFFLIFGANPLVSHGSMFGAPGMPNRLKRLKARGARLVVVDPRRTATAELADDHFAIRPGTDALLVLAMIDTLFEERLVRLGRLEGHISGLDDLRAVAAKFPPTRVAALTGIAPERIAQLARDFAAAGSAAAYCRVGVNTQSFGTLGVWAIDCLNVLTGNCDAEGGVIFPEGSLPVFTHDAYAGDQPPYGRWQSRVSGAPELGGTVPTHAMWEDIETPGPGRVRGMTIIAGNPVLSNPNARRVAAALDSLDFLVAVDIYLNETTRLADVILPPGDHLRHSEFTLIWNNWMVEDVVSWSPRILPPDPAERTDWSIINGLAARMAGMDEPAYDLRCAVRIFVEAGAAAAAPARWGGDRRSVGPRRWRGLSRTHLRCPAALRQERGRLWQPSRRLVVDPPERDAGRHFLWADGARPLPGRNRYAGWQARPCRGAVPRGRSTAGAGDRRRQIRPRDAAADRPARDAVQQQLDAQPAVAGEGPQALYGDDQPGRCDPAGHCRG